MDADKEEGGASEDIEYQMMLAIHALQVVTTEPAVVGPMDPSEKPEDYLIASVLTTICCCWLIGIFAIIYSLKVSPSFHRSI